MHRFTLAVATGVLTQAVLLGTVSGMPPHHPAAPTTAFRVFTVGLVGGFVAANVTGGTPHRVEFAAGLTVGVVVGAAFWWAVLYGTTVGVFHRLHYTLATTGAPFVLAVGWPKLAVAAFGALVAATFALSGLVGGVAAAYDLRP